MHRPAAAGRAMCAHMHRPAAAGGTIGAHMHRPAAVLGSTGTRNGAGAAVDRARGLLARGAARAVGSGCARPGCTVLHIRTSPHPTEPPWSTSTTATAPPWPSAP